MLLPQGLQPLPPDQQIVNCILALSRWAMVRAGSVASRLAHWRCGTQACFGGHLATWPEFQERGVVPGDGGAPALAQMPSVGPGTVSGYLFGDPHLFDVRGPSDVKGSSYMVVVERLERQIERLTQERQQAPAKDAAWN